jgi:hypothetical protein
MDDSDVDDFFEGVAGKPGPGQPPRASHRLGMTVRAAVRRRRESAGDALSAEDQRKRDALLDSLDKRGMFRHPERSNVTPCIPRAPRRKPSLAGAVRFRSWPCWP